MTRRTLLMAGSLAPALRLGVAAADAPSDYPAAAVPLAQVQIRDGLPDVVDGARAHAALRSVPRQDAANSGEVGHGPGRQGRD